MNGGRARRARLAICQVPMHWTTAENLATIEQAMRLAHAQGTTLCAFSELAVTGFHREIRREAQVQPVQAALDRIATLAADLRMAVAVGAPAFGAEGAILNAHCLLDECGAQVARVDKRGLTEAEATFFTRGSQRPIARLAGQRCSAVICREVSDLDEVQAQLPRGSVDLVLVPGALRQDPEKPRQEPPEYVHEICRLAAATGAHVVHTNWPNALNRPEESVDGGGSTVAGPDGELMFRLPMQVAGLGVFDLGERQATWLPWH